MIFGLSLQTIVIVALILVGIYAIVDWARKRRPNPFLNTTLARDAAARASVQAEIDRQLEAERRSSRARKSSPKSPSRSRRSVG